MMLVLVGIALGELAILLGGRHMRGLPAPNAIQILFFCLAIVIESVAFRVIIPPFAHRASLVLLGTPAIVGAHFLIMIPALGRLF